MSLWRVSRPRSDERSEKHPRFSSLKSAGLEKALDRLFGLFDVDGAGGEPGIVEQSAGVTFAGIAKQRDDRAFLTFLGHFSRDLSAGPEIGSGRTAAGATDPPREGAGGGDASGVRRDIGAVD